MPSVRGLRNLKLSRVDLVPKGSNPGAHIALFKESPDEGPADVPPENPNLQDEAKTSPEETNMTDTVTPAPGPEAEEVTTEVETPDAAQPEAVAETPAAEATPVAAGAAVEKAEAVTKAEAESIRKELDDAKTEIAKMKAEKREAEFIAKAAEFKPLGDTKKIATLLEKADEHFDESESQYLTRLLKAAVAQAETGDLFAQFGKADAEPDSAAEQYEARAKDLVAKGEFATIALAKSHLLSTDKDLAAAVFAGEGS